MSKLSLSALAACLVAALSLAACGSSSSSDDQSQITDAINAAAVSGKASACTEAETQAFVEQSNYETGNAAIAACKKDAGQGNADSVDVSNIQVDGDKATADVAITGSTFDGQTIEVSLVKDGGAWKLDSFNDFVAFDKEKFSKAFIAAVAGSGNLSPQQVQCVGGKIKSEDEASLKEAILSGDSSKVAALFNGC